MSAANRDEYGKTMQRDLDLVCLGYRSMQSERSEAKPSGAMRCHDAVGSTNAGCKRGSKDRQDNALALFLRTA